MEQATKHDGGESRSGRGRAALRLGGRLFLTAGIVAAAVFAVQLGAGELARRAEAAPMPDGAPAVPVALVPVSPETGFEVRRAFIGQVEAQKSSTLSFELPGQLSDILVDEGDGIVAGQVLAKQDLSLLEAERERHLASRLAAEARLRFAEQTVERSDALRERGFVSQAGLDGALAERDALQARIDEIDAGIASVDVRISKSTLFAPFDGRVTTRLVDGGETLAAGQPVLGLVEDHAPRIRVGVPLDIDAARLAKAEIELGDVRLVARLEALRPDIDPVTRTRTAIFSVESEHGAVFGQTARLLLTDRVEAPGLWVPVTSLQEGLRGQWTLLAVDDTATVRAVSVEVLHAESERIYVRAELPEGTRLIAGGPQRVTPGQRVITNATE